MREALDNESKALSVLRNHYAGNGKHRIISLSTELSSLKMKPNESITDYITRTEATFMALRNACESLSDDIIIAMVFKILPDTFFSLPRERARSAALLRAETFQRTV